MSNSKPTPPSLDQAFKDVEEELFKIFIKKHKDYGKGNILKIEELGIAFRVSEKIERLKNLLAKDEGPANEPIEETWTDIAVYAIIAKLYRRGWFQELEVDEDLLK